MHPHPLENDIVVRIQTAPGETPAQAFIGAARRLEDEFRVLRGEFGKEVTRMREEGAAFE